MSDSASIAERLRRWLVARTPGASDLTISDVVEPKQGFSSQTILFKAAWREGGQEHDRALVARVQRDADNPFLRDIFHQYRVMKAAAEHGEAAVPSIVFAEEDPAYLGAPFFVMEQIEGRVPSDFPSYHAEGWFADLTPEERTEAWWNGVREMEKLHRSSWDKFPFLANGASEPPTAGFFLENFVGEWIEWASEGHAYPALEEALAFLLANQPPIHRSGLVWNDARLGNTMYRSDQTVASLFDFEVATLGPPEIDMAHWLYLDEVFSTSFGINRISGIPTREETIRGFEQIYGWPMPYFAYYEAVAALKIAGLSIRDYSNGKTMTAPEKLSPFLMGKLEQYLAEYRRYLESRSAGALSAQTS
jgi:aminoglycoside phosphotransferase (APT) family kinase protein